MTCATSALRLLSESGRPPISNACLPRRRPGARGADDGKYGVGIRQDRQRERRSGVALIDPQHVPLNCNIAAKARLRSSMSSRCLRDTAITICRRATLLLRLTRCCLEPELDHVAV